MRFISSYAILAIRLALLCNQFSWARNWGKTLDPKKSSRQLLISSVSFTIFHVIRAMQIMSGTLPDTFWVEGRYLEGRKRDKIDIIDPSVNYVGTWWSALARSLGRSIDVIARFP